MQVTTPSCVGYCSHCNTYHQLPPGNCYQYGLKLLRQIESANTVEFGTIEGHGAPQFKTDYLFGEARGKMFGVLECLAPDGTRTFLHGFSGQYNGHWLISGWVEPLFNIDNWHKTNDKVEKEIKRLTQQIDAAQREAVDVIKIRKKRKELSRQLMKDIHSLYQLTNFRGETATFSQLFSDNNIPTGTGDCCGPKLLGHAAKNNLAPLSIAEFYVGRENRSGSKIHGRFYPSCIKKCQPLLGFMLCGIDEQNGR